MRNNAPAQGNKKTGCNLEQPEIICYLG